MLCSSLLYSVQPTLAVKSDIIICRAGWTQGHVIILFQPVFTQNRLVAGTHYNFVPACLDAEQAGRWHTL